MSPDELRDLTDELRALGNDTSRIEAERAGGGLPSELWATVSAFANADGGTILLGVSERDDFAVVGVPAAGQLERQVSEICVEMTPPVRADISTVVADGLSVVVVQVPPCSPRQQPCFKTSLGAQLGTRVRVGDQNRKLTPYEVHLLMSRREDPQDDSAAAPRSSPADLDPDLVRGFCARIRATRSSIFASSTDQEILERFNALTSAGPDAVPTVAGLLALGQFPQHSLPQANVTVVVFPDVEPGRLGPRGERFLDNRSVDGPLPVMVRDTVRVLQRHMTRRSRVTGLLRTDEWEYPEELLREVLVNALAHRDYSADALGTQVQVEMYPDRLVVRSPGGLHGSVRVDELGSSTATASRNAVLLKLLEDVPLEDGRTVCENRGTGILRMRTVARENGIAPPKFEDRISSFQVVVGNGTYFDDAFHTWLGERGRDLEPRQLLALAAARRGVQLTNTSYRELTGERDSRTASRELGQLVDLALLDRHGQRGGSRYELSEPPAPPVGGRAAGAGELIVGTLTTSSAPLSRHELADALGLSPSTVARVLQRLRAAGEVELVGLPRSRNARWRRVR